jgi:hypothetical protein
MSVAPLLTVEKELNELEKIISPLGISDSIPTK